MGYQYFEIKKYEEREFMRCLNDICERWFNELPDIYATILNTLFNNKYFSGGRFEYALEHMDYPYDMVREYIRKYYDHSFTIKNSNIAYNELGTWNEEDQLESISNGHIIESLIKNKKLYYDSIRCLLYQGICKALDLKSEGIYVGSRRAKLFD